MATKVQGTATLAVLFGSISYIIYAEKLNLKSEHHGALRDNFHM